MKIFLIQDLQGAREIREFFKEFPLRKKELGIKILKNWRIGAKNPQKLKNIQRISGQQQQFLHSYTKLYNIKTYLRVLYGSSVESKKLERQQKYVALVNPGHVNKQTNIRNKTNKMFLFEK